MSRILELQKAGVPAGEAAIILRAQIAAETPVDRRPASQQDLRRMSDRRHIGKDHCTGNSYCHNPTHKVVIWTHEDGAEVRWPVCERHAKAYFFGHLGRVRFDDKRPGDGTFGAQETGK